MLGRRAIPERYLKWNERYGAPFGRGIRYGRELSDLIYQHRVEFGEEEAAAHLAGGYGPFALQTNTSNRRLEYPWVFEHLRQSGATDILEIGGGLSGLQFVLAMEGASVVNVDPGEAGFRLSRRWFDDANTAFGTNVKLHQAHLQDVPLADASFDAVICISTLEHLGTTEIAGILSAVRRVLRSGGVLIATVDLFPNLVPFTTRTENQFGTNVPVWSMLHDAGFEIVVGEPTECYSAPEFDPDHVLSRLEEFVVGEDYPALVQTIIARSP